MPLSSTPRPPRLSPSATILALYTGLAGLGVLWGALRGHWRVYRLDDQPLVPTRIALNLAAGVVLGLVVVFLSRYAVHRLQWARTLHQEFRHLLGPLTDGQVLLLALASSIGEEAFFRGALVPHLGIWASSVLFALPHIGPGARFLPWTLTSFIVGVGMAALFTWGGDLSGPIAAHFTINLLNLRYITTHDLA